MLEVHITGWAATAHDKSALTVAQVEASQAAEEESADSSSNNEKTSLPMVELYTQFGSQVSTCIAKLDNFYLHSCVLLAVLVK